MQSGAGWRAWPRALVGRAPVMKSKPIFGTFGLADRPLFTAPPFAKAHGLTPLIIVANRWADTGLLQMNVRPPDSEPGAMCEIFVRGFGSWYWGVRWGLGVELPLLGIFC